VKSTYFATIVSYEYELFIILSPWYILYNVKSVIYT